MGKRKAPDGSSANTGPVTRCVWQLDHQSTLLRVLKDEKDSGNQSGAGWKNSVWQKVADAIASEFPNSLGAQKTASKCSDHYSNFKANYMEVRKIRNCSGFGWDDNLKLCVATDEVWTAYLAAHSKAARWKTTPFPLYDVMECLVHGVVATGAGAFHPGQTPVTSPALISSPTLEPLDISTENTGDVMGTLEDDIGLSQEFETETLSRKRIRASSETPQKSLTKRRGRHHRNDDADKGEVADAIREMAKALLVAETASSHNIPTTPQRRQAAIKILEDDGDFSDGELGDIMCFFTEQPTFADTYSCIEKKSVRNSFLRSALSRRHL